MAKISARGATKICSVEFEQVTADGDKIRQRMTVCSDGRVLKQARLWDGSLSGHTLAGKLKNEANRNRDWLVRYMARRGWTEVA